MASSADASSNASSPAGRRGGELLVVFAALATHVALVWAFRTPSVLTGNDQTWYILLARSLRDLSYDNLQFATLTPHAKFPPAYPVLLSLLGVTSLDRIDVAVAANACLSATGLAFVYAMLRHIGRGVALLVLAIAAVNPAIIAVAGAVNSEPLFMALWALALLVLARRTLTPQWSMLVVGALVAAALTRTIGIAGILAVGALWTGQRRWRSLALLTATSLATVGGWLAWSASVDDTRLPGQSYLADAVYTGRDVRGADTLPLAAPAPHEVVATFPALPNVHRPRGPVSGILVTDAPAFDAPAFDAPAFDAPSGEPLPAVTSSAQDAEAGAAPTATPPPAGSGSLGSVVMRRARDNAMAIGARKIPRTLALPLATAPRRVALGWVVAAGILTLAALPLLLGRLPALVIVTCAYTALLIVWPYVLDRYLVPTVPAVLAALIVGGWALGERFDAPAKWRALAPGIVAATLAGCALRGNVATWRAVSACDRSRAAASPACFADFQREFLAAAAAVRALPDDEENFLVSQEPAFYLLTGRHAAREARAAQLREPAQLSAYLRSQGVSYVLLSRTNLNQWSLARPLRGLCGRLRTIQTFGPHAALLRLVDEGAPGEDACAVVASWAAPPWPEGPPPRW